MPISIICLPFFTRASKFGVRSALQGVINAGTHPVKTLELIGKFPVVTEMVDDFRTRVFYGRLVDVGMVPRVVRHWASLAGKRRESAANFYRRGFWT